MTLILVIIISAVSISAFTRPQLFEKLQMNPWLVVHRKEYHRLLTHGFVHADWMHLIINMMVLYFFGTAVEKYFAGLEEADIIRFPEMHYLLLFFSSMILATLSTIKKYRNVQHYNSVGASGAVSAFVFASIFFDPWQTLLVYFIPLPGILFGVAYLVYSHYMSRRSTDNINHDAHFIGAVAGFFYPVIIAPGLFSFFISQLLHP